MNLVHRALKDSFKIILIYKKLKTLDVKWSDKMLKENPNYKDVILLWNQAEKEVKEMLKPKK